MLPDFENSLIFKSIFRGLLSGRFDECFSFWLHCVKKLDHMNLNHWMDEVIAEPEFSESKAPEDSDLHIYRSSALALKKYFFIPDAKAEAKGDLDKVIPKQNLSGQIESPLDRGCVFAMLCRALFYKNDGLLCQALLFYDRLYVSIQNQNYSTYLKNFLFLEINTLISTFQEEEGGGRGFNGGESAVARFVKRSDCVKSGVGVYCRPW